MVMDRLAKIMEDYFKTVTPEQLEVDLEKVGIQRCPDMITFCLKANSLPNLQATTLGYAKSIMQTCEIELNYNYAFAYKNTKTEYLIDREVA